MCVRMATDTTAKIFGIVLRELRNAAGIAQEKLALEADLDRSFVGRLERGTMQPRLETILRLARVLNVDPAVLIAKTAAVLAFIPSRHKKRRANTARPSPVFVRNETCAKCKAGYGLHVQESRTRSKGKFSCDFCDSEMITWSGHQTWICNVLYPPESWRK